jgi:hypothetical protein
MFQESSLLDSLGSGEPRVAAVDPSDANTIYYRVLGRDGDQLSISRDGGQTARVALSVTGPLTAFLRRADGTLLVGTQLQGAFRSTDGGETFAPWPEAPKLRALAERSGVLYAAADNAADGFALGSSGDGGKTWVALLRFQNLCGVTNCSPAVSASCQAAWSRLVGLFGITGCAETPPATPPRAPPSGGCAYSGQLPPSPAIGFLLLRGALGAAAARPRSRRRTLS